MSAFTDAVARNLKGVHFFSTGACPGCDECGLEDQSCKQCDGRCTVFVPSSNPLQGDEIEVACSACSGAGKITATERDREAVDEGSFSWSSCDSCGSTLGGQRSPAHGVIAATLEDAQKSDCAISHFDVCMDCVMYIANGDEPEVWE